MAMHIYPHSTPAPQNPPFITPEEYLRRENAAIREIDGKHEYINGRLIPMSGASLNHNRIVRNLAFTLGLKLLENGYELFMHDLRVEVIKGTKRAYLYPDIVIVQGAPIITGNKPGQLTNPAVVIEVLSDATESYDRGTKFEYYSAIPTLSHYLLINPDTPNVEIRYRSESEWRTTQYTHLEDTFTLLGCEVPLHKLYSTL
jgi:Uma2 family endonuclease